MENYIKDFILNVLIIFSPLVLYPYAYKYKNDKWTYRLIVFCLLALAMVTAMSFPVDIHGVFYDMRSIPMAIGSLYGGPFVCMGLFVTAVIYRYILEYPNNLLYAISLLCALIPVMGCYRFFELLSVYTKLALAVVLCTLIKLITLIMFYGIQDKLYLMFTYPWDTMNSYAVQALIIAACVYLIEFLINYHRMQEELVRNEKATIVSHMAASVAHEIRNPLTTVRGFIQLFGKGQLNDTQRVKYQQLCLEELDRAQQIITDYLTLAKPDPEVIENINLHEEIHYVKSVLLTYANMNNTQIVTDMDERTPLCITGDRFKLRQALINIGKNAIEAMPEGGVLNLRTNRLHKLANVVISDTGVGMTAEQIKRLGTPYFSTKEKGTGLGTMVSINIIKRMNGKIDIRSEIGKGTDFSLTFTSV